MMSEPVSPQTPVIRTGSVATDSSYGGDAARLVASYGITMDPWQRLVLRDWLATGPDGGWRDFTCALTLPRQNGKNLCLEVRELFGAAVLGEQILHTAHEVKTAKSHFNRLKYFFGQRAHDPAAQFPELNAMVARVRNTNGQEAIELRNGGSIKVSARSRGAARGFTVDVVVIDEAQELSDDALEALAPTLAAAPLGNPQQVWTGTVPGPQAVCDAWVRLRKRGVEGEDGLSWIEWSVPSDNTSDGDDLVRRVNPALEVGRLRPKVIDGERKALSPGGFRRERLGQWPAEAVTRRAISDELWSASAADPPADGVRTAALVAASDGHWALAAAVRDAERRVHVNVVMTAPAPQSDPTPALEWLAARWRRLAEIVVFGGSVAPVAVQWMKDHRVPPKRCTVVSTGDYLSGCSVFLAGLSTGAVTHPAAPAGGGADALAWSVASCDRKERRSDGSFGWVVTRPNGDATPLEAVSLAAAAAATTTRNPGRKVQIL